MVEIDIINQNVPNSWCGQTVTSSFSVITILKCKEVGCCLYVLISIDIIHIDRKCN